MPYHAGDRSAPENKPSGRRVAPRMALLAGVGLLAGVVLGAFAAIFALVAGLALLALDAEHHAHVGARRVRAEAQRHGARLSAGVSAASARGRAAAAARRRSVPRATH